MLATGTGPLPAEYGLAQPRPSRGDVGRVRNGALSAEAIEVGAPPQASRWGAPDWHFVKIAVICLMTAAAVMALIRERIREMKIEKVDIFEETVADRPVSARWLGGSASGFRTSARKTNAIPKADLARIRRFPSKVKNLEAERALSRTMMGRLSVLTAMDSGVVSTLSAPRNEISGLLGSRGDGEVFAGMVGGVVGGTAYGVGGLGVARSDTLRGGGGDIVGLAGLGSIGTLGRGNSGGGEGYGRGGLGGLGRRALTLSLEGEVDASVKRGLARVRYAVERCAVTESAKSFTTTFEVKADGSIRQVSVSGVSASAGCITAALEGLRLPAPEQAQTVTARWNAG